GARRRVGHHVAVRGVLLHVVLLGDGADWLAEDRLGGGAADPPPAQVDARRLLPDRLDVLGSAPGWHGAQPFTNRRGGQPTGRHAAGAVAESRRHLHLPRRPPWTPTSRRRCYA